MPPAGQLRAKEYPDATVMPFTRFTRKNGRPGLRMGVFDAHGQVVPASLLTRSFGKVGFAAEFSPAVADSARRERRAVVFGGRLSRHFGHFLLESLAKAWYARRHPDLPLAWSWPAGKPDPAYSPWQAAVLEVVGITNEPLFVTEPTCFDSVVVPDSGYRIKDFFAPEQADFLAAFPAAQRDPELRVWLSRTRIDPGILHARRLEAELAAAGWLVVHPEMLPVREQLRLLASAGRVAGDEGSAFHLLALLADVHGLRVDIFCRHPGRSVEEQNANYQTIAEARSIDQHMHVMPEEVVIRSRSTKVTKLATTLAGHREILDLPAPELPVNATSRDLPPDLAALLRQGTCLDVRGGSFPRLDRTTGGHVIVGERLSFDVRAMGPDGPEAYEMPLSDYLEHLAGGRTFDAVVVSGVPEASIAALVELTRPHAPAATWLIAADPSAVPPSLGSPRRIDDASGTWTLVDGDPSGDPPRSAG